MEGLASSTKAAKRLSPKRSAAAASDDSDDPPGLSSDTSSSSSISNCSKRGRRSSSSSVTASKGRAPVSWSLYDHVPANAVVHLPGGFEVMVVTSAIKARPAIGWLEESMSDAVVAVDLEWKPLLAAGPANVALIQVSCPVAVHCRCWRATECNSSACVGCSCVKETCGWATDLACCGPKHLSTLFTPSHQRATLGQLLHADCKCQALRAAAHEPHQVPAAKSGQSVPGKARHHHCDALMGSM